jgi:osmoprotectant transport system permease protein
MLESIISVWESQQLTIRTFQHLTMFGTALLLSIVLGISLGIIVFYHKKTANILFNILNIVETIPTIALLIVLLPLFGLGSTPTIAACILYSLLPIARNTYTGLSSVDKKYIEIAKGIGMSKKDELRNVRLPLAFPLMIGGIRIAVVFIMGIVTLGGLIAAGGLGAAIQSGLSLYKFDVILVAGIWVGMLSVIFDGIAGGIELYLKRRMSA